MLCAYQRCVGHRLFGRARRLHCFSCIVAIYTLLWTLRRQRADGHSLAPALVGLVGAIGFTALVPLIMFWRRAHNIVLGDGIAEGSTQARYDQWSLGWPHILSNPLTGHGFPLGGDTSAGERRLTAAICRFWSKPAFRDFVFFVGLILLPIGYGLRRYSGDTSQAGALSGALACSFIAFGVYRLVLSQRENHMLLFTLVAIVILLRYFAVAEEAADDRDSGSGSQRRAKTNTPAAELPARALPSRPRDVNATASRRLGPNHRAL